LHDERCLGLIELTSYAPHLLIPQASRALHHGKRVARQGSICKDINEASNQFDHSLHLSLDYSTGSLDIGSDP
jgi:hypothetical protein